MTYRSSRIAPCREGVSAEALNEAESNVLLSHQEKQHKNNDAWKKENIILTAFLLGIKSYYWESKITLDKSRLYWDLEFSQTKTHCSLNYSLRKWWLKHLWIPPLIWICTKTELNVRWPIHVLQSNVAETHPVVFANTDSQPTQPTDRQGENTGWSNSTFRWAGVWMRGLCSSDMYHHWHLNQD